MDKVLFPNLEAEIARANLSKQALAKIIDISTASLYSKTNGKTDVNLGEMIAIVTCLETLTGQKLTLDYLFSKGGKK